MLSVFRLQLTSKPSASTTTPTFSSCIGTLGLDIPARSDTPFDHPTVAGPQTEAPTFEQSEDITHDTQQQQQQQQRPTHEWNWNSLDEFYTWRMTEELDHGIELRLVRRKYSSENGRWRENRTYLCSRRGTGGKSKYIRKKHDNRIKKRSTGCRCRLTIQTFHHVSTILGWYRAKHNHPTQVAGPMFMRLRESTRVHILSHLRSHMNAEVVSNT
ncbi:hypothetical protein BJV74DRAFT_370060 [Russula compacta]|nr:hypothetical protein BJV74DRAFT_370060 [Russula compacta]